MIPKDKHSIRRRAAVSDVAKYAYPAGIISKAPSVYAGRRYKAKGRQPSTCIVPRRMPCMVFEMYVRRRARCRAAMYARNLRASAPALSCPALSISPRCIAAFTIIVAPAKSTASSSWRTIYERGGRRRRSRPAPWLQLEEEEGRKAAVQAQHQSSAIYRNAKRRSILLPASCCICLL